MQAFLCHEVDNFFHFIDTAAEGNHDIEVLEAEFFPDLAYSLDFQFEGFNVFRIIVAGRTAPAEESAAFLRFVFVAAFEVAVFTRFEIAETQRDRAGSQGLADLAHAVGQLVYDAFGMTDFNEV